MLGSVMQSVRGQEDQFPVSHANSEQHMKPLIKKSWRGSSVVWAGCLASILLNSVGSGHAQPANDDFANRIPLAGAAVVVSGDNQHATLQPGEPTVGDKSVWWSWTAPTAGVYTVT